MLYINKKQLAVFHDIIMAGFSFIIAFYLRVGSDFYSKYDFFVPTLILFTSIAAITFLSMRLYKGLWRYASIPDMIEILKSVTIILLVFSALLFLLSRMDGFPRSVLVINWLVLALLLGGPRILYRTIKDKSFALDYSTVSDKGRVPVILAGITDNSELFLRQNSRKKNSEFEVVAIIDNDKDKIGREIHGIKIYSDLNRIEATVRKLRRKAIAPRKIVISEKYDDKNIIADLLVKAENLGLVLAKLSKTGELRHHNEKASLKPIAIEDLLGRAQNHPNRGRRSKLIEEKIVMVTGAGGTIGSELCLQIASFNPAKIVLIENSEYNLYRIEQQLIEKFPNVNIEPYIADIRDLATLESHFKNTKPFIIYHAAALKHVPIVENNIIEAVKTNILGTNNVANLALKYKAKKMVLISTDKAVDPSSFMGTTKRVAELLVSYLAHKDYEAKTEFSIVRFGNVLGSSGSVIPLFQKQLEAGGPITITDFRMTRFFMTIKEAVELVLQASTLSEKNDSQTETSSVFVLDMGTPVKIKDMAEQMIKLAGLKPHEDIKIKETGIRAGEKLEEILFYDYEEHLKTDYESITRAVTRDINYKSWLENLAKIEQYVAANNTEKLKQFLQKMILKN